MTKTELYPPQPHHSASDWDLNLPDWSLTTAQFVSPPSCMWYHGVITDWYFQLCKAPGTLCMPQGRLITYLRAQRAINPVYFLFRNKASPPLANKDNCYWLHFYPSQTTFTIYELLDGDVQRIWTSDHVPFDINTWIRYRVSWWITWDVLQVRLEHELDGEWVQDGNDISIANPLFGDEAIQRCGIGASAGATDRELFWDDTEIWEYP